MKRRDFIAGTVAAGVSGIGFTGTRSAAAAASAAAGNPAATGPRALHDSTLVVSGLDVSTLNDDYVELLKQGGVNCWHKSVGQVDAISDIYNFVDGRSDVTVARTVGEIRAAHAQDKISLVFGWQAADTLAPRMMNVMLGPPSTSLRAYYELGLRIIGIAYNLMNHFGAGNMEGDVPLSRAGHVLVEEIHKLNMLLDVGGHTGERTSLDAIEVSAGRPVICSHTNIASIADNPRNVSDRLIDAIAATGGVIGVAAVNDFHVRGREQMHVAHSPRVGVAELVDQVEYVKDRVGIDHVGLGPDFVEGREVPYDRVNQSLAINREIISDGEWLYVEGFEKISQLPNVTAEMIDRGWSADDIRKVLGENWLRVYERAWGE